MSLHDVTTEDLQDARVDLDHQIAALRERKLEIAREMERRLPGEEPKYRPATQAVAPGFIESAADVPSLDEPDPRRRWWRG